MRSRITTSSPKGSVASTVAFATTLCIVAMALAPYLFGVAEDKLGYAAAWTTLILPVIATALPLLGLRPRPLG